MEDTMEKYSCPQCDAPEGDDHRVNCYFEFEPVKNPVTVIEEGLYALICAGGGNAETITRVAHEIANELGL